MELTKSGKGHELSPGAKRLISTHKQNPQLLLEKYACKPKDSHQFCFKNTSNHQSPTSQQILKKSSLKSSKFKQYEMKICSPINIRKKNNFQENIKEDVVLPISYKLKNDKKINSPEDCLVNYKKKLNCELVKKDTEKYPTSNVSYEEVRSNSLTSAKYRKEGKDQLLDDFLLKDNDISHKNEQKDLQIRELFKELENVRSAWHDDKNKFQNKIRKLEEKINKKDEEIQNLKSLLNQQVGTAFEGITNLQFHTNQFNENQTKEDILISDQSNFQNFDLGNVNNLYDNAEDEKSMKSNCGEPLKRKFAKETHTKINGRQKRQALLNSSKALHQVSAELTPQLTHYQLIQNFVCKENDHDSNLKNNKNIETYSDNDKKSPIKVSCVVFDLETNGLKRQYHNVIQISAIDVSDISSNMFNVYICPNSEFDPKSSAVNGFYMNNGYLFKNGKKMNTVFEYEAVTLFLDWLKKRKSKCILIAHNGARFDVPRLFDLVKKHNLLNYFGDLVHGFVDTLKLFKSLYPHMDKYTQTHLVKVILDIDYEAHDGIDDVIALAKLITHNTISVESIINNIEQGPLKANFDDQFMKITCENEVTLKPLYAPNITHEISLSLNSVFTSENKSKLLSELSEDLFKENLEKYSQTKAYDDEHIMVSFDLETTGLDRYYHEIVQVSAVEVNDHSEKFNIYILPKHEFDPYASKVNGLHLLNGHLCKNYYKLETVSELEGVNAFVTWLSKRKRKCILFAHNGKNFDMPRILDSCRKGDVFELFKSYVIGYVDTLPLFKYLHPGRYKYTQTSLVKDLLCIKYNAHDGLEDVIALAKLLKHKSVTNESIFSHLNSI